MWDHDAAKKFKGLCADDKDPNYIILRSEGLSGAELTKVGLDHFNNLRSTGELPDGNSNVKNFSLMSATIRLRPSGQVRSEPTTSFWIPPNLLTSLSDKARVIRMFRRAALIIPASPPRPQYRLDHRRSNHSP